MTTPNDSSHWRWRNQPISGGPAVVVDVDGVISDARHRQSLAKTRQWDDFFDACVDDPPLEPGLALVDSLAAEVSVVLLTARPARLTDVTMSWLADHKIRWDLLILRPLGMAKSSQDYKAAEVTRLRNHGFEVLYALEDDPRNVAMFTQAGVRCVYVYSGYYDR